jgi:parallel beta-helix repeat protein
MTLSVSSDEIPGTGRSWIVDDNGPADFSSIQAAIDASHSGDVINVRIGHYNEHVVIAKSIELVGENALGTVIDGSGMGNVVTVNASDVVVTGFTIERSEARWLMAGVWLSSASCGCKVTNNFITDCACGIYLTSCSNNLILQNDITETEYSIALDSSKGNVVSGNNIELHRHRHYGKFLLTKQHHFREFISEQRKHWHKHPILLESGCVFERDYRRPIWN